MGYCIIGCCITGGAIMGCYIIGCYWLIGGKNPATGTIASPYGAIFTLYYIMPG